MHAAPAVALQVEMGLIDNTLNALMCQAEVKGPLSGSAATLAAANTR
jgi:hypothetical protein